MARPREFHELPYRSPDAAHRRPESTPTSKPEAKAENKPERNTPESRAHTEVTAAMATDDRARKLAAIDRLRAAVAGPETPDRNRPTDVGDPAGRWVEQPKRHHGHEFNQTYENWVRRATGSPTDKEYAVATDKGTVCHFDSRYVEQRNGRPTEVLVDAKGRYAQFLESDSGKWQPWFAAPKTSGVQGMMFSAERQVSAGQGRPVEWWCAEPAVAKAFNTAFRDNRLLRGKITAVHRPMPEHDDGGR